MNGGESHRRGATLDLLATIEINDVIRRSDAASGRLGRCRKML